MNFHVQVLGSCAMVAGTVTIAVPITVTALPSLWNHWHAMKVRILYSFTFMPGTGYWVQFLKAGLIKLSYKKQWGIIQTTLNTLALTGSCIGSPS